MDPEFCGQGGVIALWVFGTREFANWVIEAAIGESCHVSGGHVQLRECTAW